jgi:hypothetical protein
MILGNVQKRVRKDKGSGVSAIIVRLQSTNLTFCHDLPPCLDNAILLFANHPALPLRSSSQNIASTAVGSDREMWSLVRVITAAKVAPSILRSCY